MINAYLKENDLYRIYEDIYYKESDMVDLAELTRVLNVLYVTGIAKSKICVNLACMNYTRNITKRKETLYKFILKCRDNNRYMAILKRNDELVNRFGVLVEPDGGIEIEDINTEQCAKFLGLLKNVERKGLNGVSITQTVTDILQSDITNKEAVTQKWKDISMDCFVDNLTVIRYLIDYQHKELFETYGSDNEENTININLEPYVQIEKSDAEQKEVIKKQVKEEKKRKKEEKKEKPDPNPLPEIERDEEVESLRSELEEALKDLNKYKCLFEQEKQKNKDLKEALKKAQKAEKELKKLQGLFDKVEKEQEKVEEEPKITYDEMVNAVKDVNLLIIGGHPNWHSRLSGIFKNITIIKSNEYNGDYNVIFNSDYIYFFTNHIGHGVYNKALDMMREHGISYGYINNTNLEQNVAQIYEDMSKRILSE